MALYIDTPRWPAHGTVFAHLISDTDLRELHLFAADHGLSPRAFDRDHYDVPADKLASMLESGASHVSSREIVRRLYAAGLRRRKPAGLPAPTVPTEQCEVVAKADRSATRPD